MYPICMGVSAGVHLRYSAGTYRSAEVSRAAVHMCGGSEGSLCLACAPSGRTLLENEMKGLVAGLLHEAEHAQRAAQRTAALHCLQASLPESQH